MRMDELMRKAPVIPVLVIDDVGDAAPIARALVAGGLPVLEVTLRTAAALEAIAEMTRVEGAIVGAGTVLNAGQLHGAVAAGAQFIVSPGMTDSLAEAALDRNIPFLPGVATASDIMRGLEHGIDHFKFFPASAAGGIALLKALHGPFPSARFCPTGGITADTARDWLALEPVLCVGGSWVAPKGADPAHIRDLAKAASEIHA